MQKLNHFIQRKQSQCVKFDLFEMLIQYHRRNLQQNSL